MKKITLLLIIMILFISTGCSSSSKTYRYKVETGDEVEIMIDATTGYDLDSAIPFVISYDKKHMSEGTFIEIDAYDQYINFLMQDRDYEFIESNSTNNYDYSFFTYQGDKYVHIIKFKDSKTGINLINYESKDNAMEVFKLLTFKLIK